MGLLDAFGAFGNLNGEQTEGLLAAAARGLQNSGPTRTPVSLGQAAGFAIEGFQGGVSEAKRRKIEQEQARQMAELRAMQIRDGESDYANQEQARDEAKRIAEAYKNRPSPEQQSFAARLDYLGGDTRPTLANAAKLDSMPQARAGTPGGQSGGLHDSLMAEAQWLKSQGFIPQAMAKEKEAIAARPKWNDKPQAVLGADGKLSLVQMADDGTVRPIQGGYGVAEEIEYRDLGGSVGGFGKYSGERKASVGKTMTPGEVARLGVDRDQLNLSRKRLESEDRRFALGSKPMTQLQETKYRTQIAKDYQSANTILANMDELVKSAAAVKNAPGLSGATGAAAYFPSLPNGEAAQAEVKLQNLEGKVTQLGKAAAAMGGAVGPMAVQEWKIVRDMIAAIDPKKGDKALKEQIEIVEETARGASARLRDAYTKHYSPDFERYPQFDQLAQPKEPTAPAGGNFSVIAPNGKTYTFGSAKALANFKLKAGIK